jgi:hypothetical protein
MIAPHLILVGGFLGAGKTTLLLAAGARLRAAGKRVGIILNDQGGELVDTRLVEKSGFTAQEITGGCFCCQFSEFIRAADSFALNGAPEFLLAEPVGSCTDLVATIMQPLKRHYGDRFQLAPLTILVDPARAEDLLSPDADPLMSYLFRKQIAEADLVCFSKTDLHPRLPSIAGANTRSVSARTGAGITEWLNEILSWGGAPGTKLLDIDYALYAEAEAALGWLNWHGELRAPYSRTPAAFVGPLLTGLDLMLTRTGIAISHLKVFARSRSGYVCAGICRNGDRPCVSGQLDAPPGRWCWLTINLRAAGAPETLRAIVDRCIRDLHVRFRINHAEAFRPSPPVPEHRFQEAV